MRAMTDLRDAIRRLGSPRATERNQAAIELMDSNDPEAIEPLIQAIEKPENRTARGTLIYALSGFRCEGRFRQLFAWSTEGGYEASIESMAIIRDQALSPTAEDRLRCEQLIANLRERSNEDKGLLNLLGELESILRRE